MNRPADLAGLGALSDRLCAPTLRPPHPRGWRIAFAAALLLCAVLAVSVARLLAGGVGVWGIDTPVAWGFAIINYVWWIGIGMAGTFISAALYLARQEWRSGISRYAEAMTVFAVAVSGLFPILHLGRPYFFYWLFPYPDKMDLWPQWRSALFWDFCAILAYLVTSILYWYVGMLPDLATLRDRATGLRLRRFYGLLALGWRGEALQWARLQSLLRLLAGVAVPLVFSVHSMVALDFSAALLPGWHSTLFPPFFVAGALFSGFAMALLLGIPLRRYAGLEDVITDAHLERMAKLLLVAGLAVSYGYLAELFDACYSGEPYELAVVGWRFGGGYAWSYWLTLACNALPIQLLWSARLRRRPAVLLGVAAAAVAGMWLERFMLVVTSLYRDFLPSAWGRYAPTVWDLGLLLGSIGLFLAMFLLFVRWLPLVPMHELRAERLARMEAGR
jgi:molybdopterin-containing oxidoreductase family membrane subunit